MYCEGSGCQSRKWSLGRQTGRGLFLCGGCGPHNSWQPPGHSGQRRLLRRLLPLLLHHHPHPLQTLFTPTRGSPTNYRTIIGHLMLTCTWCVADLEKVRGVVLPRDPSLYSASGASATRGGLSGPHETGQLRVWQQLPTYD